MEKFKLPEELSLNQMNEFNGRESEGYDESQGPIARDLDEELERFKKFIKESVLETTGDDEQVRAFNFRLDTKLDEYRARIEKNNSNSDSDEYKDALYKLLIGNTLRVNSKVELAKIIDQIKEGGKEVDYKLLGNAWRVIKLYAEGGADKVKGGTGF
jgi:hypothetical protein